MYVLQTIKQMTEEELDQIDKSMQMSAELNNKIMTQKLEIEEKKRKIAILEKTLVREILFFCYKIYDSISLIFRKKNTNKKQNYS